MKGITWKRNDGVVVGQIDMRKARKLFAAGKPFFIAMENMRPDFAIEIAGEDLPEPESPVKTTSESRGMRSSTSLRLFTLAPFT